MVWLDTRNLKLKYPGRKLAPLRIGPYEIIRKVSDTAYKLKLPKGYVGKIHNVFYIGLLSKANIRPGEKATEPPPELVEGELEYEVEEILQKRGNRYRVKWKGYDDPTWEPLSNLTHAKELLAQFNNKRRS